MGNNNLSQSNQTSGAGPPILPPHLLQVILNNPNVNFGEPTLLPQPNHVMLNHLYALSIKVFKHKNSRLLFDKYFKFKSNLILKSYTNIIY